MCIQVIKGDLELLWEKIRTMNVVKIVRKNRPFLEAGVGGHYLLTSAFVFIFSFPATHTRFNICIFDHFGNQMSMQFIQSRATLTLKDGGNGLFAYYIKGYQQKFQIGPKQKHSRQICFGSGYILNIFDHTWLLLCSHSCAGIIAWISKYFENLDMIGKY